MKVTDLIKGRISCASQEIFYFFCRQELKERLWISVFAASILFPVHASVAQNPTLTGIEVTSLNYDEGQAATHLSADIEASDPDSPLLTSATIQISGNYSNTEDVLGFSNAFSITGSYDALTGTLTLTGPASPADFTNALRSITYQNTNNNHPSNLIRTVSFSVNDGSTNSLTVTRNIQVNRINDTPVGQPDTFVMNEDTDLDCGCLLSNDTDPDGDHLIALVGQPPANGTVVDQGGFFIYTPNPNFYGTDSFTYHANDGTLNSSDVLVTITVLPVNDAPIALNDGISTDEDTPISISILSNDIDVDDILDASMIVLVGSPANGSAAINPSTGQVTYAPNADFNGSDSFTYKLKDAAGALSNVATVNITINAVNDAPIANADLITTPEETAISIPVLANDVDVDHTLDATSLLLISNPANGTAVIESSTGKVLYTPSNNFTGNDSFTYSLKDGAGASSATTTVTITVTPVNDAPIANPDVAVTPEEIPISIHVLVNDTDVDNGLDISSVVVVSGPSNGSVVVQSPTGIVLYSPAKDFTGDDSFTYSVKDLAGATSAATTVTVTVTPVNDAPVAVDDEATTDKNSGVDISILSNDYDVDSDVVATSVTITSNPAQGIVTYNASTGVASFTPDNDFDGNDSFTYTIRDSDGLTSLPATVSISVAMAPNLAPDAVDDGPVVNTSLSPITIDVLANDYDEDNSHDELSIVSVTSPAMGSVSIVNGKIVYQPGGLTSGTVTFIYTIQDPAGLTDAAVVTIENLYAPLTISEGFSPNNDNNNETWFILGIENYPNNSVKIFDRWGFLVYQKQRYENTTAPWDGRGNMAQHAGKLLDQGTYYYILEPGEEMETMTGYVVIVR
ncbi:Ig-like domain-containing protein [Chryseolinea sp. H1M3-3]|uniref:tandem-95 repeat protein n=1 Tax=Chryseolinea sp. H1M3-3 TaxID=3034144 RepID=UPI0023EDC90F|nr:Ig-like domain-containing protein [Chryseolinea sp. H1M3-3]